MEKWWNGTNLGGWQYQSGMYLWRDEFDQNWWEVPQSM